jgi:hypothetical protein
MTINIDALRKNIKTKTDNKSFNFWKPPTDGEHRVRILPGKQADGSDLWFESGFHRLGPSDYFNCPESISKPCPHCSKVKKLYATGAEEDKKMASNLRAKKQYYYNGIVRGEEFKKDSSGKVTDELDVKLIQVGIKIHNKIVGALLDEDIGDITDYDKGYDLVIVRKQVSGQNNYDDSYIARKSTPTFEDSKFIEISKQKWIDAKDLIKFYAEEDLKKFLEEFIDFGAIKTDYKKATGTPSEAGKKEPSKESKEDEDFPKDKEEPKKEAKKEPVKESKADEEDEEDFENWDKDFEEDIEE